MINQGEAPSTCPWRPEAFDPARQRQAAGVLARAFFDDPLMVRYLPDPGQRRRVLPGFMLTMVRYCRTYGEVWTSPEGEGVACWLPAGETDLRLPGLARAALGAVTLRLGWRALWRMRRIEPLLDRLHAAFAPTRHRYLVLLGVEPERKGQGVGGDLLERGLERSRQAGDPVYLETMQERNVSFYQRHGFRVVGEAELSTDSLRVWGMLAE
jgi:ribosomal protein S18 acetylase RimI-like enzyme